MEKTLSNSKLSVEYSLMVNNKKHIYKLIKIDNDFTKVECSSAWISQIFANEDLPELLLHLPEYITEKEIEKKSEQIFQKKYKPTHSKNFALK